MIRLVLIGGGGFCSETSTILEQESNLKIVGYIDKSISRKLKNKELEYLGQDTDLKHIIKLKNITHFFICIGDPIKRRICYNKYLKSSLSPINIIDKNASIMTKLMSNGVVAYPNSTVMSNVLIGDGVLINANSSIGHDCEIGKFSNISPGVNIAGNVRIGNETIIGIGASIRENINIGKNVIIGAGSVVVKDVEDNKVVYGNPV